MTAPLYGRERTIISFFVVALVALYAVSFVMLHPLAHTGGDAPSYVAGAKVLAGGAPDEHFMTNRILTAPLTLTSILIFKYISGDYYVGWVVVNALFFFGLGLVSFFMLRRLFSPLSAALGAFLLCANYDVLTFGIMPLSDIGGWFFYMLALFFIAGFIKSESHDQLVFAGLAIGFGGLFKEYAFLAVIPLAALVLYEYGTRPRLLVQKAFVPALCAVLPAIATHTMVFFTYHYSYLDWYLHNTHQYGYQHWLANTIKSFGAVLNMLALSALAGAFLFFRHFQLDRRSVFILSLFVPALFVLVWPSVTERLVFLAVPTTVVLSCLFFERYSRYLWLFTAFVLLYAALSLTLDSHILPTINLPF